MLGELNQRQIDHLLHSEVIGRIGCIGDGRVYVVPTTYVYDGDCVYGHSIGGTKLHAMRAHPQVCFEVEHVDDLSNWRSVIAWGTFEELHGDQAQAGMQLLMDRLMPLMASSTSGPPHGTASAAAGAAEACVYRIRIGEKTGRYEKR